MSRSQLISLLVAAVTGLGLVAADAPASQCRTLAGPDAVAGTADDVEVCEQAVWFHRADTPAGNLAASGASAFPSWDTNPPTASVTEGAGGGYLGLSPLDATGVSEYDETSAVTYEGTFAGTIDNVAITQFLFAPVADAAFETYSFRVRLVVDDIEVYSSDFIEGSEAPLASGGDAVQRIDIAVTDINRTFGEFLGDGEHTVRLTITPFLPGDEALYVYDTTEVPSGLVFNEDDLSGFTVIG